MTAVTEWQAGVYPGMPDDVYHADPVPGGSLSSSGARALLPPSCPALYQYQRTHPREHTRTLDLGSAAHKLVLGAGWPFVVIDADNYRTKAAQQARDEAHAAGATPILNPEYDQVQAMAAAIREHPVAGFLFDPERNPGKPEQSLFWVDAEYPVWRRARPDWLPDPGPRRLIIPDYKTAVSADPGHIARAVLNLGYYQQAAYYLDGVTAVGLDDDPAFIFAFQEKTPPYLVTVVQLDDDALRAGRERNRQALEIFRDCKDADIWPAYSSEIELISLPPWARSREDYL